VGVSSFTNAKPKRLFREAATWVLEVERLVPLDERVLRPTTQRLVGVEVVLFQLTNSDEGRALLGDARRLMTENAAGDASYEADEGRWIPAAFLEQVSPGRRSPARAPADGVPRDRPAALAAPALELTMLREELRELRVGHDRLQRRVAQLERGGGGVQEEAAVASLRGGRPVPATIETKPKPVGATPPSAGATPPSAGATPAAAAAAAPASEPKMPAGAPKAAYALGLPTPDALVAQMSAMIGDKSRLAVTKKALDLTAGGLWASMLTDDAHNVVGAIVANLEAVVAQGAHLMLLPEHEIAEQIKTRKPSEEVTSAMAEILNVCAAAFNAVPENVHVRAAPLEAVTAEQAAWLKSPGPRLDLGDGQAVMAFVLRGEET
jgi:hypothetical protein